MYFEIGMGGEQNHETAKHWYKKAAEQGKDYSKEWVAKKEEEEAKIETERGKLFFPFYRQAQYQYEGSLGTMARTIGKFTDDSAKMGQWLQLKGSNSGVGRNGMYMVGNDGITLLYTDKDKIDPDKILGFPIKVGTSWSNPNPMMKGTFFESRITEVGLTVKVPGGIFKNCIKVEIFSSDGSEKSGVTKWFAPNFGMVKSSVEGDLTVLRITK